MAYVGEKLSLIRRAFGKYLIEKDGVNVNIKCPKCGKPGSDKKKLAIQVETEQFHCWVCGFKGSSVVYLFRKYRPSFLDEANKVFNKKKFNNLEDKAQEEPKKDLVKDLEGFVMLGDVNNMSDPDLKDVARYAKKRGITTSMMWKYRLGACAEGRMRRRLLIPSFDVDGELNYYSAREIDGSSRMKYINAPVPKKEVIFNEHLMDWSLPVTLVEGPVDSIIGGENTLCLLGSHLSTDSEVFKKIVKNKTDVYLALDLDAQDKAQKIAKDLSSFGINVYVIEFKDDKDVADIGAAALKELKKSASKWTSTDRLLKMISGMRSGSMI